MTCDNNKQSLREQVSEMSSFKNIASSRKHSNLQALQVIGLSVRSLLGPNTGVKCVFDEESNEGILVCSTNELLQHLDIEHPVGQLVREMCLSQHKTHGCGCTTLVTLAGLWAGNVQSLLDQGLSIWNIVHSGDAFILECEKIADKRAIPVASLSADTRTNITSIEKSHTQEHSASKIQAGNKIGLCRRSEEGIGNLFPTASNESATGSHSFLSEHFQEVLNLEDRNQNKMAERSAIVNQIAGDIAGSDAEQRFAEGSGNLFITASNERTTGIISSGHEDLHEFLNAKVSKMDKKAERSAIVNQISGDVADSDDVSWFFEDDSDLDGSEDHLKLNHVAHLEHDHKTKQSNDDQVAGSSIKSTEDMDDDVSWFFDRESNTKPVDRTCILSRIQDSEEICPDTKDADITPLYGFQANLAETRSPLEQTGDLSSLMLAKTPSKHEHSPSSKIKEDWTSKTTGNLATAVLPSKSRKENLESVLSSSLNLKPSRLFSKNPSRIMSRHLAADTAPSRRNFEIETPLTRSHGPDESVQRAVTEQSKSGERSEDGVKTVGTFCSVPQQEQDAFNLDLMNVLGDGLCHGATREMNLAIEPYKMQCSSGLQTRQDFHPDALHIQLVSGPPSASSSIPEGLVLPIGEHQLPSLQKLVGEDMQALLLNGDLQMNYRHRGFKKSMKSSNVSSTIPTTEQSGLSVWIKNVITALEKLNVNLLLVRGSVDSALVDSCCFGHILVLQQVPYEVLQNLGAVHKTSMLAYISDALQEDVCRGLEVCFWSSGYQPSPAVRTKDLKIQHHVKVCCHGNLTTAVLCAPAGPLLIGAEQRLRACLARLRAALHDGKVLLGRGQIERDVLDHVNSMNDPPSSVPGRVDYGHRRLIFASLSRGFTEFISQLRTNQGIHQHGPSVLQDSTLLPSSSEEDSQGRMYDPLSAKKGAWHRAWQLLKQVLLADSLIVTGVSKSDRHLSAIL